MTKEKECTNCGKPLYGEEQVPDFSTLCVECYDATDLEEFAKEITNGHVA